MEIKIKIKIQTKQKIQTEKTAKIQDEGCVHDMRVHLISL